jgi:hypothetical protein
VPFAWYGQRDVGRHRPPVQLQAGGQRGQANNSYRGRQTSVDASATAARFANFGAYQDFRVIRLGVTLTF